MLAFGLACDAVTRPTGRQMWAVDVNNNLVAFLVDAPGFVTQGTAITGMVGGEVIVGIDFRAADGQLYGISSSSRLYQLNRATAAATAVSAVSFTPSVSGIAFGAGFNAVADVMRVTSEGNQNLRVFPTATGAGDTGLAYDAADPNVGVDPAIVAVAYTNNVPGAATTQLYGIDSGLDVLVTLTPDPDQGVVTTVGPLGVNTNDQAGMTIAGDGTAYITITQAGDNRSTMYTVDLSTGTTTRIGVIGSLLILRSIAIEP
jgi:hypothetical protein